MRSAWVVLVMAIAPTAHATDEADLLIRNARVYTVDAAHPWTTAIAIRGERILWTGSERDSAAYAGEATRTLDAAGRLILPGFIDSHFHVLFGSNPYVLPLQANSLREIREQLAAFADRRPELPWIEAPDRAAAWGTGAAAAVPPAVNSKVRGVSAGGSSGGLRRYVPGFRPGPTAGLAG